LSLKSSTIGVHNVLADIKKLPNLCCVTWSISQTANDTEALVSRKEDRKF
jgi:hypothetical protein